MDRKHKYEEVKNNQYIDYFGYKVLKVKYRCGHCGKCKIKKYW